MSQSDTPMRDLTYMSIGPHILALERAGRLFRKHPPGKPPRRPLFLTEEAEKDLGRDGLVSLLGLRGIVEAGFKRWVHEGLVFADEKGKPRFLKPLDPPPPEIWELRFTEPRVQLRLFCRFAAPNTLIATKFHTRKLLGNKGSPDWKSALNACEKKWIELFPGLEPFSAKTIHEYVTENCDDFPVWR